MLVASVLALVRLSPGLCQPAKGCPQLTPARISHRLGGGLECVAHAPAHALVHLGGGTAILRLHNEAEAWQLLAEHRAGDAWALPGSDGGVDDF